MRIGVIMDWVQEFGQGSGRTRWGDGPLDQVANVRAPVHSNLAGSFVKSIEQFVA
jgi:hypothetical protein